MKNVACQKFQSQDLQSSRSVVEKKKNPFARKLRGKLKNCAKLCRTMQNCMGILKSYVEFSEF